MSRSESSDKDQKESLDCRAGQLIRRFLPIQQCRRYRLLRIQPSRRLTCLLILPFLPNLRCSCQRFRLLRIHQRLRSRFLRFLQRRRFLPIQQCRRYRQSTYQLIRLGQSLHFRLFQLRQRFRQFQLFLPFLLSRQLMYRLFPQCQLHQRFHRSLIHQRQKFLQRQMIQLILPSRLRPPLAGLRRSQVCPA